MLGLLAGLALIEGSLELMLDNPKYVPESIIDFWRSYYFSQDQPIVQYLPECSQYDPELTYTLRPGRCRFQSRYFNTWIEANRLGTRDDERSLSGPEVIVIGDSESMGWGVEQNELYSEIIEHESGRTVLNLAVSSYGTARELQMLARADTSNLQTLIIQYSDNDLYENIAYLEKGNRVPNSSQTEYEARQKAHLQDLGYFPGKHLGWLLSTLLRNRTETLFAGSENARRVAPDESVEAPHVHYFLNALHHSTTPLRDVTILVLAADDDFLARLRSVRSEGPSRELITLTLPTEPGDRYRLDGHLTAEGHRKVAKKILPILERLTVPIPVVPYDPPEP